jgi:hypothetical protein
VPIYCDINKTMDKQDLTGFAAADFSRVRRANLGRFTDDRLMTMLNRLGREVEVTISDRPRRSPPTRLPRHQSQHGADCLPRQGNAVFRTGLFLRQQAAREIATWYCGS